MMGKPNAVLGWWRTMQPDPARKWSGDRAGLARLRRCGTVADAMLEPTAMTLFRACAATGPEDLERISLAAAVLAHVREDRPGLAVARQVGPEAIEKPETAILKPLRFQKLMQTRTPDERLAAMRRLVALADRTLNIADLAPALLFWDDDTRRRWTYEYWGVGRSASASNEPSPSKDDNG